MTIRKIIVEGGVYHITQRAPGRELLFIEDKDYLRFLSLLKKTASRFSLDVFCFALLPNHIHILTRINKINLDKAMKYLFQRYAQGFNEKYQRKGHVFCGVYRAVLCENDAHLLSASLYIHLNPFKAHLSNTVLKYKWFSLDPYIKPIKSKLVNSEFILSMIKKDIKGARENYRNLMLGSKDIRYKSILQDNKAQRNFSQSFIERMRKKIDIFPRKSRIVEFLKLEKEIDEMKFKKRISNREEGKTFFYLVEQLRSQGYTYKEIASKAGLTRNSLYRRLKKYGIA